jgi:hypothetical protein
MMRWWRICLHTPCISSTDRRPRNILRDQLHQPFPILELSTYHPSPHPRDAIRGTHEHIHCIALRGRQTRLTRDRRSAQWGHRRIYPPRGTPDRIIRIMSWYRKSMHRSLSSSPNKFASWWGWYMRTSWHSSIRQR